MARKPCVGIAQGHAVRALKHLNDGPVPVYLNDASYLVETPGHGHFHDFIVSRILNALQDHQRAIDFT